MASTALAPIEPGGYLAFNHTPEEIGEIIADNLGGEQLTEFDLARVKVPSGGGTTWEVPTLGGLEPTKALTGVLVHFKRTRAYWAPGEAKGTPPQCRSEGPDQIAVGIGDPGGPCAKCPHAEFGTAIDDHGNPGDGQACKAKEIWFLLREGDYLPIVVPLPPTSMKIAGPYRKRTLGGVGIRYSAVVTQLKLKAIEHKSGGYAVIEPTVVGMLSPEEAERAKAYGDELRPLFDAAAAAATTDAG